MYRVSIHSFLLFFLYALVSSEFTQEMAQVEYFNPKYVYNFTMFTSRVNRSSPYLTNANATILHNWGNNVTFHLRYENLKGDKEINTVSVAVCNGLKFPWIADWLNANSDVPTKLCPIPAGTYHYFKIELPPKNLPFQVLNTDYKIRMSANLTTSKEGLLQISLVLRCRKKKAKKH